ncbi:MAG: AAA family ATPase [Candidatus Methanomethylophilaceae archaeon]|nr:AAA family ATPase [Candidatus Methanomethylophilaceae archaeon]
MKVAIYGKGGIGKSTVASNLSYSFAGMGRRVLQIGCDPKADSTRSLLGGSVPNTVTRYMRDVPPSKRSLGDIVCTGSNGVMCVEVGGPRPGVGCAGKGIIGMFQTLEQLDYRSLRPDLEVYDVLGDVVCGGFAVPMRTEHSDAVIVVTSGEYMSLYAANNILKGSLSFDSDHGRVAGLVLNRRGVENEDELVDRFSRAVGVPVVCRIGRTERFRTAESRGCTVSELFPESEEAIAFKELAGRLERLVGDAMAIPTPLTDGQLDSLYSDVRFGERGRYKAEEDGGMDVTKTQSLPMVPRRIGKGPVSAVLEGAKVTDIPVVVHGTGSCGYTMLREISAERIRHALEDPDCFVSPGDNIVSSNMTASGAVFGHSGSLKATLESLLSGNTVVLVISTCLPGMIGEDTERLITSLREEHPDRTILHVDANRVDSGFDAHIEVIRSLATLIDGSVEPSPDFVNVVDDSFAVLHRAGNMVNLDRLLGMMDMVRGPGFLDDCCLQDIVRMRRYGTAVLGDRRRDNLAVKAILEAKGVGFMDLPLPRGYGETRD